MKKKIIKIISVITLVAIIFGTSGVTKTEAAQHYYYNGTDFSAVFNPEYYYYSYPDLQRSFGYNTNALFQHFIYYGMSEGRQASANFNINYYYSHYGDLRNAFGGNLPSYYVHYIYYGQWEGRLASSSSYDSYSSTWYGGVNYSAVFNALYYYNRYPDLRRAFGYNPEALLQHFIVYGMRENRQGCANFDVSYYKTAYSDLNRAFGNSYASYYYHYINFGQYEGRCGSYVAACTYNGVDYSAVYNPDYYYNHYPDLQRAIGYNYSGLIAHFVNNGMREGRQASEGFSLTFYKNTYPDLQRAFGNNYSAYYYHYLYYGINEGRSAAGSSWTTDGRYTYYSKNGEYLTGWQTIDGRKYYFDANGRLSSKQGIDVSSANGHIDWAQVKADGIDFAIIRIGYGSDYTYQDDATALENIAACEAYGIPYGVYLYSYALNGEQAHSEAQHMLRMISGHSPSVGIWIDMEDADAYKVNHGLPLSEHGDMYTAICDIFIEDVKNAGYSNVGVYASSNVFKYQLEYDNLSARGAIWLAIWGASSPSLTCNIWQYTNSGSVRGINGRVDMDVWMV
ncbi:MAG: hypothetical protein E7189_01830 [Erysipelotrichaceae bacterium]|nr:hypothetical protein [Erysipelotrichaceae bacterium]